MPATVDVTISMPPELWEPVKDCSSPNERPEEYLLEMVKQHF